MSIGTATGRWPWIIPSPSSTIRAVTSSTLWMWACPMGTSTSAMSSADVNGNAGHHLLRFPGRRAVWLRGGYGRVCHPAGADRQRACVRQGGSAGVLYKDPIKPDTYASGDFSPAYWTTAHGGTNMSVFFHLPAGSPAGSTALAYHPGRLAVRRPAPNRLRMTRTASPTPGHAPLPTAPPSTPSAPPSRSICPGRCHRCAPGFRLREVPGGHWRATCRPICCFGFFLLIFVGAPILGAINNKKRKLAIPAAQDPDRRTRHQARPDGGRSRHPDGTTARQGHDHDPVRRGQEECRHGRDA